MPPSNVITRSVIPLWILASFVSLAAAQEVIIPDPGLNAAIHEALQKPPGPLTPADLLGLTNLSARSRNVQSLTGLEAALNLTSLDLRLNHLTNFALPAELTKLAVLDVSLNGMTTCALPAGATNLTGLILEGNALTNLNLPAGLGKLYSLDLENNQFASFSLPSNLSSLVFLEMGFNLFSDFSIPAGFTNLTTLDLSGNSLTNISLPADLTSLDDLNLSQNQLTSFTLSPGLTNLLTLDLFFNQLTNLSLPDDLRNLRSLELDFNQFTSLSFPSNLSRLGFLELRSNHLTNFDLPADMAGLTYLDLGENQLKSLNLPTGLNHLETLRLSGNQLTCLTLPPGLTNLSGIFLRSNQLTNLTLSSDLYHLASLDVLSNLLPALDLPSGLTNLAGLFLSGNLLTNLTLPPDMSRLISLVLNGNPLATLVLPEFLAATNLVGDVAFLEGQGTAIFTYPLDVQLLRPRPLTGAFQFGIAGPPGVYVVLRSTNFIEWTAFGTVTNPLGKISFDDVTGISIPQRYYRALRQRPLTNMMFIPPGTFTMGSPTNEQDRNINEGPQTAVTLTRGFWIGQYEVTQGEYLALMNENPSVFPGDLSRPVSNVRWLDATNYCAKLTERDLAEGRIPAGWYYRLPTEAEWEYAARAGTTTRFSYGDDPQYSAATNYMWDLFTAGLTVHPVGLKLPNPRGLYDMYGNVWEWCQDWYDSLPGGVQVDPTGPPGPVQFDSKVMRGGAYDYPNSSCRSASRLLFPATMFHSDSDLGFRVVLVTDPQ